jgi:hypothetical protein
VHILLLFRRKVLKFNQLRYDLGKDETVHQIIRPKEHGVEDEVRKGDVDCWQDWKFLVVLEDGNPQPIEIKGLDEQQDAKAEEGEEANDPIFEGKLHGVLVWLVAYDIADVRSFIILLLR